MSPDTYAIMSAIWFGVSILEPTLWGKLCTAAIGICWVIMWAVFS